MPKLRPHPLARLWYCLLGVLVANLLVGGMLFLGSVLATVWTQKEAGQQLQEVVTKYPLVLALLIYPPILACIVFCRQTFDRRSFASLGLAPAQPTPGTFQRLSGELVRGLLCGLLAIGLLWLVLWLGGAISVAYPSPEVADAGAARSSISLLGYAFVFAVVAFMEEISFRGYVLHNLTEWAGLRRGIGLQAVIFALVHLGNVLGGGAAAVQAFLMATPSLVLIAVFFAVSYRKTGSLWFPIGFHWAWNFCLGCIFSLPVSGIATFRILDVQPRGAAWLSGASFGAEASPLLIPIIVMLIFVVSQAPDHPSFLREIAMDKDLDNPAPATGQPQAAVPATPAAPEGGEEPRQSRFRSKLGRSATFDADMLRDLKDLQAKREAEIRERDRQEKELADNAEKVAAMAPTPIVQPADAPAPPATAATNYVPGAEPPTPAPASPTQGPTSPATTPPATPGQPSPATDTQPDTPPAPRPAPKPGPRW